MIKIICCPACGDSSFKSFIKTKAQMHSNKELFNFDKCSNCKLVFLNPRVHWTILKTITLLTICHIEEQRLGENLKSL